MSAMTNDDTTPHSEPEIESPSSADHSAAAVASAPESQPEPPQAPTETEVVQVSQGESPVEAPAETPAESSAAAVPPESVFETAAVAEKTDKPDKPRRHARKHKQPEPDEPDTAEEKADSGVESMDVLMEQYAVPQETAAEGDYVEGRVVAIVDAGVVVDIGGKFEALVPAMELTDLKGGFPLMPGQSVPVQLLHEHKEGYALVSYLRAYRKKAWENIEKAHRGHEPMTGKITERIRGGLVVDIGVPAFLPASQVDLRPVKEFDEWIGRDITVRILKMNRKRGNVVVSHRILLEEELKTQRDALLDTLSEGATVKGKVKNITDYGVFVDLGGVDGLLHVTDISWGRVQNPAELVKPGQELELKILKFDREKLRISLGLKQLVPDPWVTVPQRYSAGMRVYGKVVGVTDYGAFVELEPGVEGLVHISEMTWSKRMKHPSKIVAVGDELEVLVLGVNDEQRRISLGLKQTLPDPWLTLGDKYPVGTTVTGRVRSLTDFGAFVEVEDGIDGLVHVSDITWTQRIKHPSEALKKGETIEAKVLKIDSENRRLSLGIKQVNDIWADWFGMHHIGDIVKGKVLRLTNFGAFVELAAGIDGLCHISEIEERRPKGDRDKQQRSAAPSTTLEPGTEYDFKILRIDAGQHKIALSYRGAKHHEEKQTLKEYRSTKSSSKATIGDIMLSKRDFS
jgi:small subunit ribosomal protein S1